MIDIIQNGKNGGSHSADHPDIPHVLHTQNRWKLYVFLKGRIKNVLPFCIIFGGGGKK